MQHLNNCIPDTTFDVQLGFDKHINFGANWFYSSDNLHQSNFLSWCITWNFAHSLRIRLRNNLIRYWFKILFLLPYLRVEVEYIYENWCHVFIQFQRVDPELVFTKQERIGKGSFGEVYKVNYIRSNHNLYNSYYCIPRLEPKCPST